MKRNLKHKHRSKRKTYVFCGKEVLSKMRLTPIEASWSHEELMDWLNFHGTLMLKKKKSNR